jgi:XTP/dITP diphosphohydrolase
MLKQIYFATKNKGKVDSISNTLSKFGIKVIQVSLELPEPRTDDLRKIAKEKVLFAHEQIKKPCIALDAGFYVHSLNGFPKTFVNLVLETIGIKGILKLIEGKPRECEFKNCLVYFDSNLSEPMFFESSVKGILSEVPRGEMGDYHWSELFLVFIPQGENKTLAEMGFDEYHEWRNIRYKDSSAAKFAEWISKRKF